MLFYSISLSVWYEYVYRKNRKIEVVSCGQSAFGHQLFDQMNALSSKFIVGCQLILTMLVHRMKIGNVTK